MTGTGPQRILWRRRVALAVAVWFLLCAAGLMLHAQPRPVLLALAVGAAGGTAVLFLDVSDGIPPAAWPLRSDEPVRARGEDLRLAVLRRLVSGHLDSRETRDHLRHHLVQLADRRLVAHQGVSRLADPDRAAALMAPELAAFVSAAPPYPRMTLGQINRLIDQIEEL